MSRKLETPMDRSIVSFRLGKLWESQFPFDPWCPQPAQAPESDKAPDLLSSFKLQRLSAQLTRSVWKECRMQPLRRLQMELSELLNLSISLLSEQRAGECSSPQSSPKVL